MQPSGNRAGNKTSALIIITMTTTTTTRKKKEKSYKKMWASKEPDLIQNFKNIVMDWIVISFGKRKSMFYSKIKLMNKWVNLQSQPGIHMCTPAQSCALYSRGIGCLQMPLQRHYQPSVLQLY